MQPVPRAAEHLRDVRHVSRREPAVEHRAREAVDLDDDQAPPDSFRATTAAEPADEAVERSLQQEKEVFQASRVRKVSGAFKWSGRW
jgi:hypothetical protein